MDALEERFERYVREVVPGLPLPDAMIEEPGDPATLKQLVRMDRHDPWFARLLHDERLLSLAEALLGGPVVPQGVEAFLKPAGRGTPTPPHQDGYYFCLTPNEALTFWLSLDEIDLENGALCYYPGSHRAGLFPHDASHVLGFSQGIDAADLQPLGPPVPFPVRRGDCLAHHSLTVHRAPGNLTTRPRRSLGIVYYAARARVDPEAQRRYRESLARQRAALGVGG